MAARRPQDQKFPRAQCAKRIKRQQRWIATVSVTRPLTQTQLARLQAGLNAMYGRELKINVNVDSALIGGIRVQVGDEVLDASVITRLGELQRQLAG